MVFAVIQPVDHGGVSSHSQEDLPVIAQALFAEEIDHVGDFVVVVNAAKIRVTGRKLEQKMYYRHSGYVGNLKTIKLSRMLENMPERVIRLAVKGMLPRNHQGRQMLRRLKIYAGAEHPHEAQAPVGEIKQEG